MDHENKKHPPGFSWVETLDGTQTLFSEEFQEACHSTTGAREETLLHYVRGCRVLEKLQHSTSLTILEVGFGLGIGFLTTFETLNLAKTPWHYLSLELDQNLLNWFVSENRGHEFLKNLNWFEVDGIRYLETTDGKNKLTILLGNARETLPAYVKKFEVRWEVIYQDAFSPKKSPILWTKEWFSFLKEHSSDEVILSTYSASSSIRKSLLEAGWKLHAGEKFGPKKTSTRATLQGVSDPEILLHLSRSPIEAMTDENILRIQN